MFGMSLTTLISVLNLGKIVKDAVQKQGMIGWQFNTIGVSDGITQGGDGTSSVTRKGAKRVLTSGRHAILIAESGDHRG
jgi:dihydroxyacid dehydratase/phosphogluconate dehydratase